MLQHMVFGSVPTGGGYGRLRHSFCVPTPNLPFCSFGNLADLFSVERFSSDVDVLSSHCPYNDINVIIKTSAWQLRKFAEFLSQFLFPEFQLF
jgi:hypothetical protein